VSPEAASAMRSDFVVIGAGICGLSAAWALSRRGHGVTVIDQAPVGHRTGGSHGSARIFRLGYEKLAYVDLARQARHVWAELESAAGEQLLHPTPQLTFGPLMGDVRDGLRAAGVAHEELSAGQARERFPGLATSGDTVLLEPDSAVIAADRSLAALSRLLCQAGDGAGIGIGADGAPVRATAVAEHGAGVRVGTTAGAIDADRVIVCAGPWTAGLVGPAGIAVPGTANLEQVAYLDPAEPPGPVMPIFVQYGSASDPSPYGLPVPGSTRYKLGLHHDGPPVDPDRQVHDEDSELSRRIERATRQFLPAFDPVPAAVERCVYDNSPDTDFIIDRVGAIVIGSGTSGHGFKFGPLIGEWLADLATGRQAGRPGGPGGPGSLPGWFGLGRFLSVP
jgi:sarcosine oxidase